MVLGLELALLVLVVATPAVLTGLGARRRGGRLPLAVVSGLLYPFTWAVWYVRDRRPATATAFHKRSA